MTRLVFGIDTIASVLAKQELARISIPRLIELETFKRHCEAAAHKSCILRPEDYKAGVVCYGCKLFAHCTVVAWAVQQAFGGSIQHGFVRVYGVNWAHSWNRLPEGIEVDLTSRQFRGGDGLFPVKTARLHHTLFAEELSVVNSMKQTKLFMRRLERVMRRAATPTVAGAEA